MTKIKLSDVQISAGDPTEALDLMQDIREFKKAMRQLERAMKIMKHVNTTMLTSAELKKYESKFEFMKMGYSLAKSIQQDIQKIMKP
jgi:GTP1/Obg family GTP-binding protein